MSITISVAPHTYTGESPRVPAPQYSTAQADEGTWILYEQASYNPNPAPASYQIIQQGGPMTLEFQPQSLRQVTTNANAVQLFEHNNFGGDTKTYTVNTPSLPFFPAGQTRGVSSIYIPGPSHWKVYPEPNYAGKPINLKPGFYHDAATIGLGNDTIQSIMMPGD